MNFFYLIGITSFLSLWAVKGISFYDVLINFFLYSFIGWIYESTLVSVREKTLTNRGFLNGPIIPIYGCAATLIYMAFYNDYTISLALHINALHMIEVFFFGMIIASILEYVTSYLMEKFFHAKWWDYSNYPLNIKGRISLPSSLFWGLLSIVMVYLIQPAANNLVERIPRPLGDYLILAAIAVGSCDFIMTVVVTLKLSKQLEVLERLREEVFEYTMGLKWYEKREELKGRLSHSKVAEFAEELRGLVNKNYERFVQRKNSEDNIERKSLRFDIEQKLKNFMESYNKSVNTKLQRSIYSRIFKAFPNMKMIGKEGVFADFKDKLKNSSIRKKK
ncbi:putative ABC transporter permease [Lachnoclostridium phytofermentans]|uniref:Uncharacterized protein n=1 Tax=Lachnoclostridium phytofermentans (strain ATCC 700394 / DSM 18823 / ISDg) TaxID=357809 RepID=A9KMI7_LACP7|nr:putative ABC transporter permease [Lachnoclostridium phytofermentans]ABX41432.1 protein of unknown function DUF1113 [Lachnoclostridium phytofermentans ISDg]